MSSMQAGPHRVTVNEEETISTSSAAAMWADFACETFLVVAIFGMYTRPGSGRKVAMDATQQRGKRL
jgi:hypothetical protein